MSHYRDHGPLDCKLYVGDLGHGAAKHELEDAFNVYGPLRNVWVARNPPGFAFVEYEDPRDAADAIRGLDGRVVCGRRVRVEGAQSAKDKSRSSRRGGSSRYGRDDRRDGGRSGRYGRSRSRSPRRRSRHSRSRSRSRSRRRSHRTRSRSHDRRSRSDERRDRSRSRSHHSKSKSPSPARSGSPEKAQQQNHSGSPSPEKKQNGNAQPVAPGTEESP